MYNSGQECRSTPLQLNTGASLSWVVAAPPATMCDLLSSQASFPHAWGHKHTLSLSEVG